MINVPLNIVLHPAQQVIYNSPARFKIVKAGKKFGKSYLAEYVVTKWAGKPNGLYWYLAPTYGQGYEIAWMDFMALIPRDIIRRKPENDQFIQLVNGSSIYIKGCDNIDRLRGPNLDGVIFDEAAYIDQYVWEGIIQSQLATSEGPSLFISSPNKKGRNWFTNFCEDAKRRQALGESWAYFYHTIYDNPFIRPQEIQRIKDNTPDDTWALEYMAQESAHAGQIYSEFSYSNHVGELDLAA